MTNFRRAAQWRKVECVPVEGSRVRAGQLKLVGDTEGVRLGWKLSVRIDLSYCSPLLLVGNAYSRHATLGAAHTFDQK